MKKLLLITGAILTAYIGLTTAVTPAEGPSAAAVSEISATESGYLIGISEGRVAVYRDGGLYLRTGTLVSSLPKSDRNRLERGIHVDSVKELKTLLQDLCS